MHPEALAWVAEVARAHGPFDDILELGGRNVNGTVRPFFPRSRYISIDISPGPDVDIVADAATWRTAILFDAVVCCEVLEHVEHPEAFVNTAREALVPDGRLILTAACPPRAPHSGVDGGPVRPGEWYRNIEPDELCCWLADWDDVAVEVHGRGDVYATARKGPAPWLTR